MPEMSLEVQSVLGMVDAYLQWKDQNGEPRGYEKYHPSAWGHCLRLMQYQRYSERGYIPTPPDPHQAHICRVWGNGHGMHDRWREYFTDIGVLRGYWTCTNPLCKAFDDNGNYDNSSTIKDVIADPHTWLKDRRSYGRDNLQGAFKPDKCVCGWERFKYDEINVVNSELNFHGHADMILDYHSPQFDPEKYMRYVQNASWTLSDLPQNPVVVDMKSINHYDFQEVAKGNPDKHYLVQLTIYANLLNCSYGILIYENKNNQRVAPFKVEKNENTWWPRICQQALLMNQMVEVEDEEGNIHHLLPPPRYSSRDSKGCGYCPYKDTCHISEIWETDTFNEQRKDFYGELLDDHI